MNREEGFHDLIFNHHQVFDQEIQAVTNFDNSPVVGHGKRNLGGHDQPPFSKLMDKTLLIGGFEQTRS